MTEETTTQNTGKLSRHVPGIALVSAVAMLAMLVARLEQHLFGRAWLDALVIAILAGTALRSLWHPPARFQPGISFSGKMLLEIAVVLIGTNISSSILAAAGWSLLLGIATVVALSMILSYGLCRALGLNTKVATLVAAGNSICGNSAIAAVAPVIGAQARDVTAAIAFTAVLGVIVVLLLPVLAVAWDMSSTTFGIFAGMTVYAVPQVLAATAPISSLSAQVGTIVKLVRVLMLGPLVLALSLSQREADGARPSLTHLVPWFIVGFLGMIVLRSLGLIPEQVLPVLNQTATLLTLMAMAALGLGVDIRDIAAAGPRMTAAVTLSILVLATLSLLMIRLTGFG